MKLISITTVENLKKYKREWDNILEENQNTNPFIEFDWVYTWWEYIGQNQNVVILAVEKGNKVIAFFPFTIQKRLFFDIYSFIALGQANYVDIIVNKTNSPEIFKYVIDQIFLGKKGKVFYWHGLLESTPTYGCIKNYLNGRGISYSNHKVITPYVNFEEIEFSKYLKERKNVSGIDRREKRLRMLGELKGDQSKPNEMERIFQIYEKRWANKNDTSGFTDEHNRKFYEKLAQFQSGPLATYIYSLYLENEMIAFTYGFICRGRFVGYILGHDDDFEHFHPGTILLKEEIKEIHHRSIKIYDMSIGYEPYKFEWANKLDYTHKVIFASNRFFSNVYRLLLSGKENLISQIKKNYSLVLFKRNTLGKVKALFKKGKRYENIVLLIKKLRLYFYENVTYEIFERKIEQKRYRPTDLNFPELTIHDLFENREKIEDEMSEFTKRFYNGYKGYFSSDKKDLNQVIWVNPKVIRIDQIDFLEDITKKSIFIDQWTKENLLPFCKFFIKKNKIGSIFVSIRNPSNEMKDFLKENGFIFYNKASMLRIMGKEIKKITRSQK